MKADSSGKFSHRVLGTVLYADEQTAVKAIGTLNGRMLNGRALRVAPLDSGGLTGTRRPAPAVVPPQPHARDIPKQQHMIDQSKPVGMGHVPQQVQPMMGQMNIAPGMQVSGMQVPITAPATTALPMTNNVLQPQMPVSTGTFLPIDHTPTIKSVLENMPAPEMWGVLNELKTMATSQPEATKALLLQYPVLSQVIMHIQSSLKTLRTPTPAYSTLSASLNPFDQYMNQQQQEYMGAEGSTDGFMQQQGQTAGFGQAPVDEGAQEQKALVQNVLMMTDAEVNNMPMDQREGVLQIRTALQTPIEQIMTFEPSIRDELLALREQLTAVLNS